MEKQNNEPESWSEIIKNYAELQKMHDESNKHLTTELLRDSDKRDFRKNVVIVILILSLVLSNLYWVYQWSSYDYVSQDGNGYNYYNEDVGGDVNNVAEDQEEKEQEEEQGNASQEAIEE